MQWEEIIGRAILGDDDDKRLATDRITCKAAASANMFCPACGGVLDQARIVVVEVDGEASSCACRLCFAAQEPALLKRPAIAEGLASGRLRFVKGEEAFARR